jgi:hypothetical protein
MINSTLSDYRVDSCIPCRCQFMICEQSTWIFNDIDNFPKQPQTEVQPDKYAVQKMFDSAVE